MEELNNFFSIYSNVFTRQNAICAAIFFAAEITYGRTSGHSLAGLNGR